MATKSFTTEFKLNSKGAINLISALNASRKVDIEVSHEVKSVHGREEISNLVDNLIKRG